MTQPPDPTPSWHSLRTSQVCRIRWRTSQVWGPKAGCPQRRKLRLGGEDARARWFRCHCGEGWRDWCAEVGQPTRFCGSCAPPNAVALDPNRRGGGAGAGRAAAGRARAGRSRCVGHGGRTSSSPARAYDTEEGTVFPGLGAGFLNLGGKTEGSRPGRGWRLEHWCATLAGAPLCFPPPALCLGEEKMNLKRFSGVPLVYL